MLKLFIDPGHGGRDPGAVGRGANSDLRESDIVLDVSLRLQELLRGHIDTKLSRESDIFLTINERWQMSNVWGADFFLSIHANAGGGTGAETLYFRQDAHAFATSIQDSYSQKMQLRNRRVWFRDDIGVVRHTSCPSILLELAFIDAPDTAPDLQILRNQRQEMAETIAEAIFFHLQIKPLSPSSPAEGRFMALSEIPDWGRPTIAKLIEKGALKGDGSGLNLSEDMLRLLVINDRMGLYS